MPDTLDPRTASAVTRAFFDALNASPLTPRQVAKLSGHHVNTFYNWRMGKASASVLNMEAALDVLGLELAIRPKRTNQESE
jgi:hypothetical protein